MTIWNAIDQVTYDVHSGRQIGFQVRVELGLLSQFAYAHGDAFLMLTTESGCAFTLG